MRRFILLPAAEVAANWLDPVSGLTVSELLENLQARPASLSLVAEDLETGRMWLQEAAELAVAKVLDHADAIRPNSRWVQLLEASQLQDSVVDSQLLVFLARDDQQSAFARRLGFIEADIADKLALGGYLRTPRYLLTASDRQWAVHELVSALEAMDCPVEVIPNPRSQI